MNYYEALSILNLHENFSVSELKKRFNILALKFHPDKNPEQQDHKEFDQVLEAYIFLKKTDKETRDFYKDNIDYSYSNILTNLVKILKGNDIDNNISDIIAECNKYSLEIFEKLESEKATPIYLFITNIEMYLKYQMKLFQK